MFEITRATIARIGVVVNRNLLLVRYSFERIAKSFKRGELQRKWGGKVTIGTPEAKPRCGASESGESHELFELVRALASLVAARVTLNPHTQKPAY